jgi:hypothetical protein
LSGSIPELPHVEKRFCRLWPSKIDSRQAPNAQYRFKESFVAIRLLRAGGVLRTFSTASVISGSGRAS